MVRARLAALLLVTSLPLAADAAPPSPLREAVGGVTVDFSAGTVTVAGAAAADLHAPNAAVARVRAERAARAVAAARLAQALPLVSTVRLGCGTRPAVEVVEAAAARAALQSIEWASDGSVALVLQVVLAELVAHPAAAATRPTPDGGVAQAEAVGPGVPVLLVEAGAEPTWFREEAGYCAVAPRYFETVTDARAGGGELKIAQLVLSRQTLVQAQQEGRGPFAPLPRVVAIARRDDTSLGAKHK